MTYLLARPPEDTGGTAALARVEAVASERLTQARVAAIDGQGLHPAEEMHALGAAGAFAAHLAAHAASATPSLPQAIAMTAAVSARCMATGFCTWCQDSIVPYLEWSDNAALRAWLQPDLANCVLMGGTGLSNAVKSLARIEDFKPHGQ